MSKSKLEKAIDGQLSRLNDAQRELVKSQFSVYMQNKRRIGELDDALQTSSFTASEERSRLCTERNQLTIANNEIASKLFQQLDS